MQKTDFLAAAAIAASATLAACNSEPEAITVNKYDAQAEALKKAAPIEAPPIIQVSHAYRCADNSLVYVDFLSNNTANVRTERGGVPVAVLTAQDGNPPYTGSGYTVSAKSEQITYTAPGKGAQSCHT